MLAIHDFLATHGNRINAKDINNNSTLDVSCSNGRLDIVKYLVSKGIDVKTRESNEATYMHSAAKNGHLNIVKYLAENGCDINEKIAFGQTPLFIAAICDYYDIV